MILQLNRTVIEWRKPRNKGRWTQGLVRERLRRYYTVEDVKGKRHRVHHTWMRPNQSQIPPALRNLLRRAVTHNTVNVSALNKTHMAEWMGKKGGGDLKTALVKAGAMWREELKTHDPSIHPITGKQMPILQGV